uniref:DUF38 domain-containing protein n=1 Tax=Panagrolaimus sp. ES5 TaxID=591445 RepID=A0AC34F5E7_9BILA
MRLNKRYPKLWACGEFHCERSAPLLSITRFAKFDPKYLFLRSQILTWEDYQILTSSGSIERLEICSSEIKYSNGTLVTLDKLLRNLPFLQKIKISKTWSEEISFFKGDTVKNMLDIISNYKNLQQLLLINIREDFDFLSFMEYILKNESVDIAVVYDYSVPLSDAYVRMLHNFVDKILKNPPKRIPEINYLKLEDSRYYNYQKLRRNFAS